MSEKDKKNIPEVRFDGFDEEWEKKKLSDVSAIKKGEQLNKENMVADGQYPVMNGGIEPSGMTDKPNTPKETISISEGGNSCGYVKLNHTEFWSGGHNYTVNKPTMNNDFLYQSLKSQQDRIMNLREGTGLPNIQKGKIENIDVQDTSLKEQKKIAEFFKQLDKLIELNEKKVEKLEALKKSLLEKMFPIGAATPKIRFDGFNDNWTIYQFYSLFDLLQNNTLSRAELNDESGNCSTVHYGDILTIFPEVIDMKTTMLPFVNDVSVISKYKNSVLSDGDIVIADTAEDETVGKCCEFRNGGRTPVVSGLHTIPCRPKISLSENYLGFYMNAPAYHNQLLPLMQGIKVSSISKSALQNTSLSIPNSYEEQQKVGLILQSISNQIKSINIKIEKLRNLKISFLNKMIPHTHTHSSTCNQI